MRSYPKKTQTRTYVDVHYLWFSHRMEEGPKPCDEPKFVIFYNMLVAIFQLFCFHCKCNNPSIEVCKDGESGKCNPKMQSLWETIQVEEPAVNVWKASWKCDVKLWYVDIRSKDQPSTTYVQEYGSLCYFSVDILLPPKEIPVPLGVKLLENSTINTS